MARSQKFYPDSSLIESVDYDDEEMTLTIEFVRGGEYSYARVSSEVYLAFVDSPSKGKFFSSEIKDKYPFRKIR